MSRTILSLSDLHHLVWSSLVPSLLLQMAAFRSCLWQQYSTVCMCHIFIHSSVDRHLICFHVLAIANNAAMNIGVCVKYTVSINALIELDDVFIIERYLVPNYKIIRDYKCRRKPSNISLKNWESLHFSL